MSNELKLGFFVTLGLIAIIVTIMMLGNYSLTSKYEVYTYFSNASGLPKKAKVKISGVDVGNIKNILLENGKAKIVLVIDRDIKLYSDAKAKIVATGIIGTKYMELNPGTPSNQLIHAGDTIESIDETASMEDIVNKAVQKVEKLLDTANNGLNEEFFKNLSDTVKNLKDVSQTIANKENEISKVIDNFKNFSSDLYDITNKNKDDIRNIVLELKKVSENINNIINKIDNGDGTIATLINDEEMAKELKETVAEAKTAVQSIQEFTTRAKKLEIDWEYMGRFDTRNDRYRNDFGIRFRPNNHKFYYLGISNIADTHREKDTLEREKMNKLDALIGFRSENFEIYGGALRSKGGIGIGWSPLDKVYSSYRKLYFNVEGLFRTETADPNDPDRDKPNLIIGTRLGIFNWCYVGVQVEDTLTRTTFVPYIKIKITDEDLAALFGVAGIAATTSK